MIGSSFGLQESPEINASLDVVMVCMLWAWKGKIMHENSPFSSFALISKGTMIIAMLLLILCISDAQKKNSKKRKRAATCELLAFKHSSVHCLLVFVVFHTYN